MSAGAMDMEERTRQMKLKVDKYKQGTGSDSRLEQDHHSKASHRAAWLNLQTKTQPPLQLLVHAVSLSANHVTKEKFSVQPKHTTRMWNTTKHDWASEWWSELRHCVRLCTSSHCSVWCWHVFQYPLTPMHTHGWSMCTAYFTQLFFHICVSEKSTNMYKFHTSTFYRLSVQTDTNIKQLTEQVSCHFCISSVRQIFSSRPIYSTVI